MTALLVLAACAQAQKPAPKSGGKPGDAESAHDQRARSLFLEAVERSKAGDLTGAAQGFESAFQIDGTLLYALSNAGALYERLGDLERARGVYERALVADPGFEPASVNLMRLRLRSGQAAEAEADLTARLAKVPGSTGLRNQLAEILIASGKLDGAEQQAKKILKSDERNVPAMLSLASVYHAKKRHELAKMVLENARQVDPREPSIWNKMAFVELALGNRPQALEDLKTAASLRPDYPEAHLNYGAMLVDAEDFAGATRELELAVQYLPDSAPAHLDLGNAYRGTGTFAKAQEEYERALKLDPKLTEAIFDLAVLYLDGESPGLPALARLEQALAYLDRFVAAGGADPKLAQYRRDANRLVEKEKKRLAREEKEKLRKEAEAKKKEGADPGGSAGAAKDAEKPAASARAEAEKKKPAAGRKKASRGKQKGKERSER